MMASLFRLRRFAAAVALGVVIAPTPGVAGETTACGAPAAIGDGWAIAAPDDVGLDGQRLCAIAARLTAADANVHGVVVVRHGKLIFEQYFSGYDRPWGAPERSYDFDASTKHDMRSVSKSVNSLLIGIAIDRKLIASLDEPVLTFLPDHAEAASPGADRITLRHLLTMSSGLSWDEARAWSDPRNDEPHLGKDSDPLRYVLTRPIAAPAGAAWVYNGGGTDLLGEIVARVSGQPFDDFAREFLFQPLGITDWEWKRYANGRFAPAAGLRLRPRDAAKIGQLLLNKGRWNGRQIVAAEWIAQSIEPRYQAIGYFGSMMFYGYSWWLGRTLSDGSDLKWIAGVGLGGQRLFVVPDLDMVVMTTSGQYASPRQGVAAIDILSNVIVPAVRDRTAPR